MVREFQLRTGNYRNKLTYKKNIYDNRKKNSVEGFNNMLDKGEKSLNELKDYENIQTRTVRNKYRKLIESGKKVLGGKM